MSKLTRITQKQFGSTGPSGDFGEFGSLAAGSPNYTKDPVIIQDLAAFLTGWAAATITNERPALEDMNSLFFLVYYQLCYILQQGIPEWDAGTTYYIDSVVMYDSALYVSIQDSNLSQEPDIETTYWSPLESKISGDEVQVVNTTTGAVDSITAQIPADNSKPQISEGEEVMTATITPTLATNKLKIDVVLYVNTPTSNIMITAALFNSDIDAANALACGGIGGDNSMMYCIKFTHYMTAGIDTATTFRIRVGANSGNSTFNGVGGSGLYNGVLSSSITITEIQA